MTGADYSDVNELLEAGRSSTDESERAEIYRNLTIATNEHRNNIVLYHENNLLGVSNDVSGVEYFSDGVIRLKTAALNSAN